MSYLQRADFQFPHRNVSERVIQSTLNSRGYERHIAGAKPPPSPEHVRIRKQWAEEHLLWTPEQWSEFLKTNKTWTSGNRHSTTWVTRKVAAELRISNLKHNLDTRHTRSPHPIVSQQGPKAGLAERSGASFFWKQERCFTVLGQEMRVHYDDKISTKSCPADYSYSSVE